MVAERDFHFLPREMCYSFSSALTQRELGGRGRNRAASGRVVGSSAALAPGSGFSLGYKAQLLSNYLPNHHQRIETFSHQVFNGIYSTCGDMFVSACQGKLFCATSGDDFHHHFDSFKDLSSNYIVYNPHDVE